MRTFLASALLIASAQVACGQNATLAAEILKEFMPGAPPAVLGKGKNDVGVGEGAWKCQADMAAYIPGTGVDWARHNPNGGVGIRKASQCQTACFHDVLCPAFVYFAAGNKNVKIHNPAGIMPGSCWLQTTKPWLKKTGLKTVALPGLITCWKPKATEHNTPVARPKTGTDVDPDTDLANDPTPVVAPVIAPAETPTLETVTVPPVPSVTVPTLAPVVPRSVTAPPVPSVTVPAIAPVVPRSVTAPPVPSVTVPTLAPVVPRSVTALPVPSVTVSAIAPVAPRAFTVPPVPSVPTMVPTLPTVPIIDVLATTTSSNFLAAGGGDAGGRGGSPWMWVLGLGGLGVVGAIVAAVCCGACDASDKPKKKNKSKRTVKPASQERDIEPLMPTQAASSVTEPPTSVATLAPAGASTQHYLAPQYANQQHAASYVQILQPQIATHQHAASYVQMPQPQILVAQPQHLREWWD